MSENNEEIKEIYDFEAPETLKQSIDFVTNLFEKLGFNILEYQMTFLSENNYELNFTCDENAMIIGKKGVGLTAFQIILNSYISKNNLDIHVSLDIGGYRKKQSRILQEEINKIVQRMTTTKSPFLMEGLFSPVERKQIHLYVQTIPGFKSRSEGEGFLKPVWIDFE